MADEKALKQLSRESLKNVKGGIPYEKPVLVELNGGSVTRCSHGFHCESGSDGNCISGRSCSTGSHGGQEEPT